MSKKFATGAMTKIENRSFNFGRLKQKSVGQRGHQDQGCQIFQRTIYQSVENIPNDYKITKGSLPKYTQ
jgi:hypothetical protein